MVDVLFAIGYGGSREEATQITSKSNNEGIDGVTNEDGLGLDVIYVQAKRWQNNVGRRFRALLEHWPESRFMRGCL